MNVWLMAAGAMLVCLIPCGVVCLRGDAMNRLVGLEAAGVIAALAFLLLAEGFGRQPFADLALALALLAFGGGLVFARFLERWMRSQWRACWGWAWPRRRSRWRACWR